MLKVTTDLPVLKAQLGQRVHKVCKAMSDLPAHRDLRAQPVRRVKLEIPALRGILDRLDRKAMQVQPAQLEQQVQQVLRALLAILDQLAHKETRAFKVRPELRALRGLLARLAIQEPLAQRVQLVHKATSGQQVHRVYKASKAFKVYKAKQVLLDLRETSDLLAQRVLLERQDLPEMPVRLAQQELQDRKVM